MRPICEIADHEGEYKDFTGVIDWQGSKGKVEKAHFKLDHSGIYWVKGTWLSGVWENGAWLDGFWINGTWENGIWVHGLWRNGIWKDGEWHDGKWEKGTWFNGTKINGIWIKVKYGNEKVIMRGDTR